MNKENFTGDGLDSRIVERLGERNRKLESIAAWERKSAKGRYSLYSLYSAVAVAACVALAVMVAPFGNGAGNVIDELGIEQPRFGSLRAASVELAEVERLLDEGLLYEALDMNMALLKESDKEVKAMENEPLFDDEEWMYEYQALKMYNAELRWNYIYLLVLVDCERDAVKELKKYMRELEYCTHYNDAVRMLRALD